MAKVTGYTAAKMAELADANIVAASLSGDNLILTTLGGTDIDVGSVRGAQGPAWLPQVLNTAAAGIDWNSLTTPGLYASLMHGATNPNGPGATYANAYYYVMTYAYTTASGNVTQMAYPYQDGYPVCYRVKFGGTWGAWVFLQKQTPILRAKMIKSTTGHDAAGSALSANTWTKYTGITTTEYSQNITPDLVNGNFTIPAGYGGNFDILFQCRTTSFGSGYNRAAVIVKGTSAPASDASNVLGHTNAEGAGWAILQTNVEDAPLAAGDVVSFWVRSAVATTFNTANTAIPGWTFMSIVKRPY